MRSDGLVRRERANTTISRQTALNDFDEPKAFAAPFAADRETVMRTESALPLERTDEEIVMSKRYSS